jgi:hypothetical protein
MYSPVKITGGAFNGLPDAFPNLQLLGGTVTLSPTFQTNGAIARLDLNGATLAGTYPVSGVLNFNSGFIAAAITVVSNGVLNWNSGRFSPGSSLLVNSNGFLNLASNGEKDIACVLTNYGTATWTGGTIYLMNDGGSYLGNIQNNIDGVGGLEHIEAIELVVHGPALKTFVTASIDPDLKGKLDRLQVQGVTFGACGNTMKTFNLTLEQLPPGARYLPQGGVVRVMELVEQGYVYIRP